MKVGQTRIVRWISKQVTKRDEKAPRVVTELRELDASALRLVSGGTSQSPFKGW